MTDKELMQQALEALDYTHDVFGLTPQGVAAKTALRERLAQPEQEPLLFEQIETILARSYTGDVIDFFDFARAIEAAHGITGEKK